MKWFREHLNLTTLIVYLALFLFWFGIQFGYIIYSEFYLLVFLGSMLINLWVLRQKKRSLWWLLILLIPFGLFPIIFLSNKSKIPKIVTA
jgi:hypothetical protein